MSYHRIARIQFYKNVLILNHFGVHVSRQQILILPQTKPSRTPLMADDIGAERKRLEGWERPWNIHRWDENIQRMLVCHCHRCFKLRGVWYKISPPKKEQKCRDLANGCKSMICSSKVWLKKAKRHEFAYVCIRLTSGIEMMLSLTPKIPKDLCNWHRWFLGRPIMEDLIPSSRRTWWILLMVQKS